QCYPIAIDGTQKLVRNGQWQAEQWLERRRQRAEGEHVQQYVYVLEANRVLHNGVTLPLLSEFLSYGEGDPDDHKQDCELKAFYRLAARLKAYFPRLPIVLLLDGLYPNGPLMALGRQYQWQFMIVLPAKCLPLVWEEVEALKPRPPHYRKHQHWHGPQQQFGWVNDITSSYEGDRKSLLVHGVGCEETWQEVDPATSELIDKQPQPMWLSSQRLCHHTVHERCNLGARQRWGIEVSMQVEKRQGYCYEHAFSHHWNAMQGYHYLMRLAHLLNALALATKRVASQAHAGRPGVSALCARELCPSLAAPGVAAATACPSPATAARIAATLFEISPVVCRNRPNSAWQGRFTPCLRASRKSLALYPALSSVGANRTAQKGTKQ
ncbi:MAG TPA: hypothetical protein VE844_04160, partial [Gammaproteobacteria bacterium]|nr:hypothetical protein [Gammaproteobacteria bacterium]